MKKIRLLFVLLVVLVPVSHISAQRKPANNPAAKPSPVQQNISKEIVFSAAGAPDADGWRIYQAAYDAFRIAFPPTPVAVSETDGRRYYNPVPVTSVRLNLTVTVTDLPMVVTDADLKRKLYHASLDGIMDGKGTGGKAIKILEKEIVLGGSFGLEVIVDRGDYRYHAKTVCIGSKLYHFEVGSKTPGSVKLEEFAEIDKWSRKFFDSLKVSPASGTAQAAENQ